jgi:hypothetical protein
MKKIIVSFLFSLLCSYISLAQISNTESNTLNSINEKLRWNKKNQTILEEVYLFNNWENGTVYFNNKKTFPKATKYNYYIPSERMHILKNKDTLEIQSLYTIDSIIINNRKFIYTYFEDNKKIKQGYFEEICAGSVKLLKRHSYFYIKNSLTVHRNNTNKNYKIRCDYYSQKGNCIAGKVKLKKQNIFNILPSHKEEIKVYLKKNNINKEANLINLFEYYNSLQ